MVIPQSRAAALTRYIELLAERFMEIQLGVDDYDHDMNKQEHRVLMFVGRAEACTMGAITDHMNLVSSTITAIVNKLVEKDLLQRGRPAADRRKVIVELTASGLALFQSKQQKYINLSRGMLGLIDEDEQTQLLAILHKIADRIDGLPAHDETSS